MRERTFRHHCEACTDSALHKQTSFLCCNDGRKSAPKQIMSEIDKTNKSKARTCIRKRKKKERLSEFYLKDHVAENEIPNFCTTWHGRNLVTRDIGAGVLASRHQEFE